MMNTVKITNPGKPLMVAHRGLSGLETENTCAAFVAAGNRSYFGIETDVHRTRDGKYVVFHDDTTGRLAAENVVVEETDYEVLRDMLLKQKDGAFGRTDIRIPSLQEYIAICKKYEKIAVLELKNHFDKEDVFEILEIIEDFGYLDQTIFISFDYDNLVFVKEKLPGQPVQFLTGQCDEALVKKLAECGMDLDLYYKGMTPELARICRRYGVKINCWTVDSVEDADYLIECGVEYITSNILE